MNKEIWKDISGYEGIYQVSNFGRICGLDRYIFNGGKKVYKKYHILKERYAKTTTTRLLPYRMVVLSKNGVKKNFYIHRIVAKEFIPNPQNKPQVDHIDGNLENNCVENLRWCTQKENNNNIVFRRKQSRLYNGEIARDVALRNGISYNVYRGRIERGWDIKKAITEKAKEGFGG